VVEDNYKGPFGPEALVELESKLSAAARRRAWNAWGQALAECAERQKTDLTARPRTLIQFYWDEYRKTLV
jgi:hypothetical protein